MLPLELASISEPEETATEYLHYRQFFNIWETLARVVECQALEVQVMSKDTKAAWLKDYVVSDFSNSQKPECMLMLDWDEGARGRGLRTDNEVTDVGVAR